MARHIICESKTGTADKAIEGEACLVYWIIFSAAVLGTAGTLIVRDGFDTGGTEKMRITSGYALAPLFDPPFLCDRGLYIDVDSGVAAYTIGYQLARVVQDHMPG